MNERKNNWMDGWARYFSTLCWATSSLIKPLRWGTSSLSYFSEQPLICATSALSCLPAFVASATHVFSSRNCYNAFSSLQLQSRIAQEQHYRQELPLARLAVTLRLTTFSCNSACQERRGITHAMLRAAVPMCFVTTSCKPAWQERCNKSTNVRAASTVRTRPRKSCANLRTSVFLRFSLRFLRALAIVSCTFCPPHLPIVLRMPPFLNILKCISSSRPQSCALFVGKFVAVDARARVLQWPQKPHYPKKGRVLHPRVFSPVNSHASELSRTVRFPYLMMGAWHDDVVHMMVKMLTMTIVRNSEVF